MLGKEMEEILEKRKRDAERFGGGDYAHKKAIATWKTAINMTK